MNTSVMAIDGAQALEEGRTPTEGVRSEYQAARTGFAVLVFGLGIAGMLAGVPGSPLKTLAAIVVATDALLNLRRPGIPAISLAIDAVAAGLAAGAGNVFEAPLIALAGYVLAATVLFASDMARIAIVALTGMVVVVRVIVMPDLIGGTTPEVATVLGGVEAGIYMLALAVTVMVGARHMREANLRQQEALDAERRASEIKNEFVSMITHELRTPLTNIAGFALTVEDSWRTLQPEEVDEFLEIIVGEAEHLQNLVEDVLAIPRLEAGRLLLDVTDFALQPSAYKIADLLYPAGGEKSATVSVSGNVVVRADPNRVEQVLRNLLENARKYGGDLVTVDAELRGSEYVVVVADNGPGVGAGHRDRVFDAFEQLSSGDARTDSGFGLGLAVTKHLVEAMEGEVWYEPGFPVGARFCFSLPVGASESSVDSVRQEKAKS